MSQQRRWWLGMGVILLVAAGLRFTGYRFGLPYFDHSDEPWFFYEAAWQRGLVPFWLHPNPSPALIDLYKLAQVISETLTHESALAHVPDIFTAMRFVSVILSLLTIVFVGLSARELADDKAGWIAAATWALIPYVIYHSFIAIAEPWMMLCAALALYTAARAFRRDDTRAAVVSVWAGLLGFAFKYSMFPFAGIGLAAALWKVWSLPSARRKWLIVAAVQIVSIVGFLAFLLLFGGLVHDVDAPAREVALFFTNPLRGYSDLGKVAGIVGDGFWQFGMAPLVFGLIYAAALVVLARRRDRILPAWLFMGALGAFVALLVPAYLYIPETLFRYLFAASLIFTILAAASVSVIYDSFRTLHAVESRRGVLAIVALVGLIIWLSPLAAQAITDARDRLKPYTLTDMMVWASNTLEDGGVVAEGAGHRTFNREWGGYFGDKRLLTFDADLFSKTPQEWRANGYNYVEMVQDHVDDLLQTPEGSAYLSQMQELRRFPPPETTDQWTGLDFVVYQLSRPQAPADFSFGDTFHLIGVDGLPETAAPGDDLSLRFYWQSPKMPAENDSLFIHLLTEDGEQPIAQADGAPGPAGRPTLTWAVPSETLVSEPFALKIPDDLAAGQYRLMIGIYNPYSGQRLPTAQGDEALLATLSVK